MRSMSKSILITLGVALLLTIALAATALAAGQGRERRAGQNDRPGAGNRMERMQGMMERIVLGEITSISGDTLTVKPELPQELIDRLAEHGVEPPALPDSVTLQVTDDSRLALNGSPADLDSFNVGDKIAAFCDINDANSVKTVRRMADADTARQAMERFRGQGGGPGMGRGGQDGAGAPGRGAGQDGPGMGPGMGQQDGAGAPGMGMGRGSGMRDHTPPVFGKITSITDDEITVKVEIPEFIVERMTEMGREIPDDLPSEVVMKYSDRTRFRANGEFADSLPFKVGDEVMAMVIKIDDVIGAAMICDLATAKERMEEGFGGMGPGSGPRDGTGAGRPWRNEK